MSTTPPTRRFSPEIQALRALAVGLVVVFHVWPGRVPGGYVGVDVFFVISGFLITGHLWRERVSTGTVDLLAFWARRIRRLLPAAALVLLVSLVGVSLVAPIQRFPAILEEFWASVGLVENWTLAATSVDYFDAGRAASPFQHYWSLSVEEQFYIVWPVLLLVVVGLARRLARRSSPGDGARAYVTFIGLVGGASLAYSIVFTAQSRDVAYFSTLTHVWEFAVGALLSFRAPRLASSARRLTPSRRQALTATALVVGVVLIVAPAVVFTDATPFPGWRAGIPAAGALLVVATSLGELPRPVAAVVAWRPIDLVGAVSYSLYLWHWPVLIVGGLLLGGHVGLVARVGMVVASVVLAWLTKRFVEDPARRVRRPRGATVRTFALGAVAVVILLAVSIVPSTRFQAAKATAVASYESLNGESTGGGPSCIGAGAALDPGACPDSHDVGTVEAELTPWLPILEADTAAQKADSITWGSCTTELAHHLNTCSFGPKSASFHIEIAGDSHAFQWAHTVLPIAAAHGWRVSVDWHSGCPLSVPGYYTPGGTGDFEGGPDCQTWQRQIVDRISGDPSIDVVVMSSFSHKYANDGQSAKIAGVEKANQVVMKRFADAGEKVVVLADVPYPGRDIPFCVSVSPTPVDPCTTPREQAVVADPMAAAARSLGSPDVSLVDVTPLMCDASICHSVIGGITAYQDSHHLSSQFLDTLRPVLEPRLVAIAKQKKES